MKSLFVFIFISLFYLTNSQGQAKELSTNFSFAIQNGISNHLYFGDKYEEYNLAHVNALRLQMAFQESQNFSSIIGLQYGKTGISTNWVCGTNWDYCEMHGVPPIEVKSTERKHFISLFYNSRITVPKNYYIQGGLSIDFPFISSLHNKYESSDGQNTRDKDSDIHGRKILINSSFGANLLMGKSFTINDKWSWFVELEYKMYNLIAIRFEDYEDYFFLKREKPWVLGVNIGVSFQ